MELKFRGITKIGDMMLYGNSIQQLEGQVYIFPKDGTDSPDFYEVKPETIGVYSGIDDKNGNMIFSGDVHGFEIECDGELVWGYYPVIFENGSFWLDQSRHKDGSDCVIMCQYDEEPLDIQGNIFQNPELLEVK